MNNQLTLLLAVVVTSGCVAQNSPVRVGGTFSPGGTDGKSCELKPDIQIGGGSLDASGSRAFFLLTTYTSSLQEISTFDPKGIVLADSSRNNFVADTLVLNYSTKGEGAPALPAALKVQRLPTTLVILPATDLNALFNVISGPMSEFLSTTVVKGDKFVLNVNYGLSGYLASASSGGRLDSNFVDFPITVSREVDPCPAGTFLAPTGPCGTGGVNGGAVICCDPANPVAGCIP
jgi:hypothetical protein